jgi:hypothetical protein
MPVPAKTLATELLTELGQEFSFPPLDLSGADYQLPDDLGNPLYADISRPEVEELTSGVVEGTGSFDRIMSSLKAHLEDQYARGLITGDQYTKAYIEMTSMALSAAMQFVIQGDQAYWQNLLLQQQGRRAEVELVTTRVGLATAKAQYQAAQAQAEILEAQYVQAVLGIANEDARYNGTLAQIDLVREQLETARAQTTNTRTNGDAVTGVVGKQKDLYTQQIDSYQKDAAFKVGKMYVDSWLTQKTIDEGLTPPNELINTTVNTVLNRLRTSVALT